MAQAYQQTDTALVCSPATLCAGGTLNGATGGSQAQVGGTAGTTELLLSIDANASTLRAFFYEFIVPAGTVGASGTLTIRLNLTTKRGGLTWEEVHVCRINSSCVNQETIGSSTALAIDLGTTGVKSTTVSGSAITFAAGDKVMVIISISSTDGMARNIGITPSEIQDTPWTPPSVAGAPEEYVSVIG